jgi:hypothetical protein
MEPTETINLSDTIRASWNFSLDRMRQDMAHFSTEEQDALVALFRWCIDPKHPIRREEAARRLGCSGNLLYQLYTGVYRNPDKSPRRPSPELIQKIRDFLDLERKRYEAGELSFVVTPTVRKIVTACDLARESQTPVFVTGPSHIGKTFALEHYRSTNNHGRTIYVRMRAASGLGGMVRRIADCMGISDKSNTADLIERIKRGLSANTLLILDEVHLLAHTYRKGSFHNCMEVLRELYDESRCGMVLCFTILDDVKAASQKELQQLWRRGTHKVFLPGMPTKADIATILEHNGMQFPDRKMNVTVELKDDHGRTVSFSEQPYELIRQLAKEEALKSITERIRYARKLAGRDGGRIGWNFFVTAHLLIKKQADPGEEWT